MRSEEITKSQASVIYQALFPGTNYLVRLKKRMGKCGFPHDDELYQLVCKAYEAALVLGHKFHYMSCDGVGKKPRPETNRKENEASRYACGNCQILFDLFLAPTSEWAVFQEEDGPEIDTEPTICPFCGAGELKPLIARADTVTLPRPQPE